MKYLILLLLTACNSSGEKSNSGGLPNGTYVGGGHLVEISGNHFYHAFGLCSEYGTYTAAHGELHAEVSQISSDCGALELTEFDCTYEMQSSSSLSLQCPDIGLNGVFGRN